MLIDYKTSDLTHSEPDSLKKSLEDLSLLIDELDESVDGGHPLGRKFCEVYDRLTEFIQRKCY